MSQNISYVGMQQSSSQVNQNIKEIPLQCECPSTCPCDKHIIKWNHKKCHKPTFINTEGDLNCHQHQCSSIFIQHAKFYCTQFSQGYSFRSASQFLMSLAQGLQAAEFNLKEKDLIEFSNSINANVIKRWNQ